METKKSSIEDEATALAQTIVDIGDRFSAMEAHYRQALDEQSNDPDYDPNGNGHAPGGESCPAGSSKYRKTMKNPRHFEEGFLIDIAALVQDFNLRGENIQKLLYRTLAIFDPEKDVKELQDEIRIPAPRTLRDHFNIISKMERQQLSDAVLQSGTDFDAFTIEADEGQIAKKKRFVVNFNLTEAETQVPVRFHAGAKPIPNTSGEQECQGMIRAVDDYDLNIACAIGMTSDSASTMEKARELFAAERKTVIEKLIEKGDANFSQPTTFAVDACVLGLHVTCACHVLDDKGNWRIRISCLRRSATSFLSVFGTASTVAICTLLPSTGCQIYPIKEKMQKGL